MIKYREIFYIIFDGTTHTVTEESKTQEYLDVEGLTVDDIIKEPISGNLISFPDEEIAIDKAQELDQEL